jgi:hypothetical protein
MPESSLYEQLCLINNVYANSISPVESYIQNTNIRTRLLPHQQSMVHAMHTYEMKMTHGYVWNDHILHGKVGIVADPAGSGKTLSVLSYIADCLAKEPLNTSTPQLRQGELDPASNRYFYSNHIEQVTNDASSTYLIVVSPTIYNQWKHEISTHTTLNVFAVDNRRILRNRQTPNQIQTSKIVLTTSRFYKYIIEYAEQNGIRWKYLFIDDASTIHLTGNEPDIHFDFMWLITNNWLGFLFKNIWITPSNLLYIHDRLQLDPDCMKWLMYTIQQTGSISTQLSASNFFKQYIPYCHPARSALILRNRTSYIEESNPMPEIIYNNLQCRQYYTLTSLRALLHHQIPLNEIPNIYESLGVQTYSKDQLIERYSEKRDTIHTKSEDDCSICLDTPQFRILTTCCMNAFCGRCILRHSLANTSCPTCRSQINFDDMVHLLPNETSPSQNQIIFNPIIKNRHETCIDYIRSHSSEPILLYTMYENNYYQLLPELQRMNITWARLEQNTFSQTVDDFNAGNINLLFLSNISLIHGLSLTRLKHIIFFYELSFSDQKDLLISSAQRIGRQSSLTVVQLYSQPTVEAQNE